MYQEEYKRWLEADLEDADLSPELARIEGNDEEIKDRFAVALKFGTAGLRGVLGAGTNRMNIYVVRQATQGLANWVKTQGGTQTVARINGEMWSELFIANKEPLIREIDDLVQNLEKFRAAIDKEDSAELESLMASANKIKEEIG